MIVEVIAAHVSNYPNPIRFQMGDRLVLGRFDDEWPHWIRTKTNDGNEGWAPIQFIEVGENQSQGIAKCDYCAFELNTVLGEKLWVHQELNEWVLAENSADLKGWVPANTVKIAGWSRGGCKIDQLED